MKKEAVEQVKKMLNAKGDGALLAGEQVFFRALGVCPLLSDVPGELEYLTYEEALEASTVSVTELSESGSVPELMLVNSGEKRVLVLDGEQLVGAKQNRVMNTTVLIEAASTVVIPVSCVEQGRWHYETTRGMRSSDAVLYARTRARKSRQVNESLQRSGFYHADQHAIWEDISQRITDRGVHSPTYAMADEYASKRVPLGDFLENLALERFTVPDGMFMVGAAFTIAGKVIGLDAFGRHETLRKQWTKLVNSYAIEALHAESGIALDPDDVASFMRRAAETEMLTFEPPGLGTDVRLAGENIVGGCLVVEREAVHLFVFNAEQNGLQGTEESTTRIAGFPDRLRNARARKPVERGEHD